MKVKQSKQEESISYFLRNPCWFKQISPGKCLTITGVRAIVGLALASGDSFLSSVIAFIAIEYFSKLVTKLKDYINMAN